MSESDRPTQVPPDAPAAPVDETTRITCLSCDGHYQTTSRGAAPGSFAMIACRWCTLGTMSREQALRWSAHQRAK